MNYFENWMSAKEFDIAYTIVGASIIEFTDQDGITRNLILKPDQMKKIKSHIDYFRADEPIRKFY